MKRTDTELLDWVSRNWEKQEFAETLESCDTPKSFRRQLIALMDDYKDEDIP